MLDEHSRMRAGELMRLIDAVHCAVAPFHTEKGVGKRALERLTEDLKRTIEYADLKQRRS
jgi:hypothetical protein